MKTRILVAGLACLAGCLFLPVVGNAYAGTDPAGTCVVHSLPSFVAQGEFENTATVGDVITVSCDPTVYGTESKIKFTAAQLYTRCKNRLVWFIPNPYSRTEGRGVTVSLDADGNATVAVLAGPGCAAGESLVSAHMEEEPFETFTTSFSVLPPEPTPPGVFVLPATQIEDAGSSGVATIIEAEFESGSEKLVRIGSEELYRRCRIEPHLRWINQNGEETTDTSELTEIRLDNDGNAFVIVIGDSSCAPGPSLIEADLESKPFTTFTTPFTIEPPKPGI